MLNRVASCSSHRGTNDGMKSTPITLTTSRLQLVEQHVDLAEAISVYRLRNVAHLAASSPLRPDAYHAVDAWRERLASQVAPLATRATLGFALQVRSDARVIGHIDFSQIARGAFQSCFLGYGIDQDFQGQGLMSEALAAAIAFAFSTDLHRIQANHLPDNTRSAAVLAGLGFHIEGHARNYLWINGQWRDHVMTALLNPNPVIPLLA